MTDLIMIFSYMSAMHFDCIHPDLFLASPPPHGTLLSQPVFPSTVSPTPK